MIHYSNSQVHRLSAIALFIAAPVVLLLLAAVNFTNFFDARSQTAATAREIERYQTRLTPEQFPSASAGTISLVIGASSRSLAEADLQRRLIALVAAAQARIVESGAGIVSEEQADAVVEVRVTFDGDNAGLLHFLHAVETGIPLMTISDLAVRRVQGEDGSPSDAPDLRTDVVVRAPWKAEIS